MVCEVCKFMSNIKCNDLSTRTGKINWNCENELVFMKICSLFVYMNVVNLCVSTFVLLYKKETNTFGTGYS